MAVPTIRPTPATRTGSARERKLLGLPGTGGYVGWLRAGGTPFYKAVTSPGMRRIRVGGVFARLRLVERIRLSPEDYSEPEMRRLTRTLCCATAYAYSCSASTLLR